MKKTLSCLEFQEELEAYECGFSYEGTQALFEYFEELEADSDTDIEFDGVAIRCEYTEYENIEEFHKDYDSDEYPNIDTIRDYTTVIEVGSEGFIIVNF